MIRLVIDNTRERKPPQPTRPIDIDGFVDHMIVSLGLHRTTIQTYRRIAAKFVRDVGTDRPTHDQVLTHMRALLVAPISHSYISDIMKVMEHYMAWIGNPIKLKRPRKVKRLQHEVPTEAEVAVILSHTKGIRELAILSLLATSGIRNAELCALRVGDVDMSACLLFIREGKGLKDGIVNFDGNVVPKINQYLAQYPRSAEDWLFTTLRTGEQYSTTALRRLVKRVVKRTRIDKPISPHTFRRALASHLIDRGAPVRFVQKQLRHAFITTTMIYVQTSQEWVKRQYPAFKPSYL